jgi:hypothetical protein
MDGIRFLTGNYIVTSNLLVLMANSNIVEGKNWTGPICGPVNSNEGEAVASKESSASTHLGEEKEGSEMDIGFEEGDFGNLEDLPDVAVSLQRPMDLDSDMRPETVTESWADSMDDINTDYSRTENSAYEMDSSETERRNNVHEDYSTARYLRGPRRSWRPAESRVPYHRWSQAREGRGREFRGGEFRDREIRSRGFRGRGFRGQWFRGRGRGYRNPQSFTPRASSIWSSQIRQDYRTNHRLGRRCMDFEQDRGD